ncbi:hypothetical protein Psi01_35080 [Planobispora siamensis]|uniref:Uncharacterized protein n=1 Tax=Planobispora siamensis TaxID=936338 RepID=A0A8J3SNL2_9ACTN|nr:hypothetical protein Psi01_35080 [Planobispora siamensis]
MQLHEHTSGIIIALVGAAHPVGQHHPGMPHRGDCLADLRSQRPGPFDLHWRRISAHPFSVCRVGGYGPGRPWREVAFDHGLLSIAATVDPWAK